LFTQRLFAFWLVYCCFAPNMYEGKVTKNSQLNSDQELMELGRRIRALRISKGYKSAEKFALDHNLSRVHYGRWEAGKKKHYIQKSADIGAGSWNDFAGIFRCGNLNEFKESSEKDFSTFSRFHSPLS
jgi:hypothetical protein